MTKEWSNDKARWIVLGLLVLVLPVRAGSFRTDILPILTKAGCNAGACHGTSTGQGGFRLSLLGYDPEEDFWTITREFEGRRVDLEAPERSLFLRKPVHEIDHEGGRRIKRDSREYRALVEWISKGAPYGEADLRVTKVSVEPADWLARKVSEEVQLRVSAELSNGQKRDVTELALYTSNDEGTAEVDAAGRVKMRRAGPTSIMIRFGGQVAAARVAVPFPGITPDYEEFEPLNFIDRHILAELKRLRVSPAWLSGDGEFLRRVHLDLTGRLPDPAKDKVSRKATIERLLRSEEFVDFWTMKLADLLLINGKRGQEGAAETYHHWLRDQVARNRSWEEIARELLTGTGEITKNGPANFYTLATDPRDLAEHAGRMFLGMQIGCARCHAHPSDRWTQEDYYNFSAFFARVEREGGRIGVKEAGEIEHPKSLKPTVPTLLGGSALRENGDRREALARSVGSDPHFARAMANRVWKELLGRGLVEPADDLRPTNPASHPALLEELAAEFAKSGYDLRSLIRTIVSSRTYQLSSRGGEGAENAEALFARAIWKPLPAPVLVDAISQVTGIAEKFDGAEEGRRAVQLIGAQTPSYALDVLGRCSRERSCESASAGGGLAQALHLINGSTINEKLSGGMLTQWKEAGKTDVEIVEALYLRALTRRPTAAEAKFWNEQLTGGATRDEALEDLLWTLLNCREFNYNH